jgi:SAM-dependent methyltransferase
MYSFEDRAAERQRKFWSSVGDAWRNESEAIEEFAEPLTRAIHEKIGDYPRIALDLGCGSRSMPLPPSWRVFGVDPVSEILTAGKSVQGSSQALPFQDASVDAVVSRLAVMLDSDPGKVFAEVRRVLRMAGTFTFVVWDKREANLWTSSVEDVLKEELSIRDARPDEPSAYRLADDAEVAGLLRSAGLRPISSERIHAPYFSTLSPDATFDFLLKFVGPVRLMFLKVSEDRKEAVRAQIVSGLAEVSRNGSAWIHHAEREVKFD